MLAKRFASIIFMLICLCNASCEPFLSPTTNPVPEVASTPTTATKAVVSENTAPASTPNSFLPEALLLRIRLSTTSDWTNLALLSGGRWQQRKLISADEWASTAVMDGGRLVLIQPISRAEVGERAEMVIEVSISLQENTNEIIFEIRRGDIGSTLGEIYKQVGEEWVVIRSFSWSDITGDGENPHNIVISLDELSGEVALATAYPLEVTAMPIAPVTGLPQGTDGYPWWNDSIFYEIFVRSFYDSNGDGIGDINGIIEKLDYLNDGDQNTTTDLGISGIWLMPIYPSHSYHGYAVTDYYSVNPDYGTLEDLKKLLAAAHSRGIRVILDFSVGHTSYQHPWFMSAADPSSPYHDWYIWSDHDPGYLGSWGQQVWWPVDEVYYYATFGAWSPDLNLRNPAVTAEIQNVIRFWLQDVGVDGFRLDSAKHLIEEGSNQANTAPTHAWWKDFRTFYIQINPQAVTVAEIWDQPGINAAYAQGDELNLVFDFYLAALFIQSINEGSAVVANEQIELSYSLLPALQFAPFLTNHDQDRLMSQLGNDPQKVKVAASLLMTSPGVPFIYYGEEIGMKGSKPDEQIRRPMQWSEGAFSDFSTVNPWEPLGPDWEIYNVSSETGDPESILSYYHKLIKIRNEHTALRTGDLSVVSTGNDALYSILRASQHEAILVLINLTGEAVMDYTLSLDQSSLKQGSYSLLSILGESSFPTLLTSDTGSFSKFIPVPEVPPYSAFILQLQLKSP